MKTLIFSDTHLSRVFDPLQFNYLKRIISAADLVIINGDFWDRSQGTFDQFMNSRWQPLFPLLKSRLAIYVFGNHDKRKWTDTRVNEFSVLQCQSIRIQNEVNQLLVMHGQSVSPQFDRYILKDPLRAICGWIGNRLEATGLDLFGKRSLTIGAVVNKSLRNYARQSLRENEILICGHSHLAEYNFDAKFINSGINKDGVGQYIMVDEHNINFVEEFYRAPKAILEHIPNLWRVRLPARQAKARR